MKRLFYLIILGLTLQSPNLSAQFQLNGTTTDLGGDCYRLTTTVPDFQIGTLFTTNQINLNESFEIHAEINLGSLNSGADGMSFLLQSQGNTAQGLFGGGMGYETISPSVIVEFDTFQNNSAAVGELNDPPQDHIDLMFNGNPAHAGTPYILPNVEDGIDHSVRFVWDATANNFTVYFDCTEVINYTGDIITDIFGGSPNVYWGFTASTGGSTNFQEVCILYATDIDHLHDDSVCEGSSTNIGLDDIAGFAFEWSPTTGLDDATSSNPSASPTTTTNYVVTITDACNDTFTDQMTLTVDPSPTIPLSNQALLCSTEPSVNLDATITNGTYSWSTGANTPTIDATTAGIYTVTVTNNDGCSNTQTTNVTTPPIVFELGTNQTRCVGEQATLDATPTGATAPTYEWQDGSTNPTFTVTTSGTYTVTVTDQGCSVTDAITFLYNPLPDFDLGANQTPCPGEDVTLDATPTGATAPTYEWQDGSTNPTFTVTTSGTYTVTVTDLSCSSTDQININYNQLPNVDIGGNQSFCEGETPTLSAVPSNAVAPSYEWQNGTTDPTFTVTAAGTYTVTVTDQGCQSTSEATITYNANPDLNFGEDFTICGFTSVVTLNPLAADSYVWQDGSTDPSFEVSFPGGTYAVTVTTAGCSASDEINIDYGITPTIDLGLNVEICEGESYTITPPIADSYEWQDGSTTSTYSVTQTGLYSVEITSGNCSASDDILVTVLPVPTVDLGEDVTLCEGETRTLNATTPSSIYEWQDGSTNPTFEVSTAGTYTVTVTTGNCSASDEISVSYNASPTIDLGDDFALCEGETSALTAPIGDSYQWQNGETTQSITASTAGIYGVSVTNNNCLSTGSIEISVNPIPTFDLGEDITLCEGETTILTAPIADSYQWQNGSTASTLQTTNAGTYSLTITSNNCSSSDAIDVNFNPLPAIELGEDLTLCAGETTTLNATPSNEGDLGSITYLWQDGTETATYGISTNGTYSVTVTSNNCQSTDAITVNFDDVPSISLGEDQTLCEGETLELDATLEGATYEWQDNSTDPTLTVSQAGDYSVTVTLNSCILTGSISIDYQDLPTVDLGTDQELCEGETVVLDATTTDATYLWSDNSTNPTLEVDQSGDYSVSVTVNGCVGTDIVSVNVTELPAIELGENITLCEGQSTLLDATPSNLGNLTNVSYRWQDNSTDPTLTVSGVGTYEVTVTANDCSVSDEITVTVDAAGTIDLGPNLELCEGETAILDATTPDATYQWQDDSTNPTIEVSAAGTYAVTVNTSGCLLFGSVQVTYTPQPTVDLGGDQTLCEGELLTLDATTPGATYEWQDASNAPTLEVVQSGTYTVTVSVNNCRATDEVTIDFNAAPTVDLGADQTVCEGTDVTLTAPTGDSYLWSNADTDQAITVNQSDIYTVTVTSNGCSSTDEVEIIVNPAPTVDLGADATLCQGESTILDATFAGATYVWSDNSTNPTLEVDVAGTYAVTVSVGDCSTSDTVDIGFDTAGTIDLGADATICEGETLTLDASTTNATYVWSDNSTNPTLEVNATGTYEVTVTIAGGCLLFGEIDVTVAPQPTVDLGADLDLCEGETATLDATLAGATYVWSDNSTNPTLEVTQSGQYTVTVSVGNCSTSDAVGVNFAALPSVDLGADVEICEGESATLTAPVADSYSWSNTETSQEITVSQSGTYTVTITSNGCSNTDEVVVGVRNLPVVDLGADATLCNGETRTLDATNASPAATYEWQDASTNPTLEVSAAGTYAVTVTVGDCSASDEIVIDFDDAGTVDLGADVTLCEGETLELDATTAGATYVWQDNSTNPTFEVTTAGIYAVTVSSGSCNLTGSIEVDFAPQPTVELNDLGFCDGESVVLDATFAGATYEWQDGSTDETLEVDETGTYTVTVTVGSCSVSESAEIVVIPLPTLDLGEDISVCSDEPVSLTASLADTYVWSTGSNDPQIDVTTSGIYTVTITSETCSNTDEIAVDFGAAPEIDLGGNIVLCGGLEITLNVIQPTADVTYEWQDGSTDPVFNLSESGTYAVTVTAGDCVVSDEVVVTLQENPTIDLGQDTVLCAGQTLMLTAPLADAYLWQDGSTDQTFEATEAGTYTVETEVDDCQLEGTIQVSYAVEPTVAFEEDFVTICEGETTTLEAVVTDAFSFDWLNGVTTPTLEVTEAGFYTLQVFGENATCAVASDEIEVRFETCETPPEGIQLAMPTAFSPNGDGFNDTFGISSDRALTAIDFKVYNRWGVMVFESMDVNASWDGIFENELQPIGVYVYYLLAEYEEDGRTRQFLQKGNVSLVR